MVGKRARVGMKGPWIGRERERERELLHRIGAEIACRKGDETCPPRLEGTGRGF